MGQVSLSIIVQAPVEKVFAFVADFRNAKRYMYRFTDFEPVGEKTYGLGAKVRAAGRVRGFPVQTFLEVVEFELNRKIVSRSFPSVIGLPTWLLEKVEGGTRVTFASDFWIPKLPFPVPGQRMVQDEVQRHVRETLRALKKVIEEEERARPPAPPVGGEGGR